MGILFRSAIVVGVIVYLSPLRNEAPAEKATPRPSSAGMALSGAAESLWQALPDTARKSVTDEAKRQLLNEVRNNLLPEAPKVSAQEKASPSARTAHKRTDASQAAR